MEANPNAWLRAIVQRVRADRRLALAVGAMVLLGVVAYASSAHGNANSPTAAQTLPPAPTATSVPTVAPTRVPASRHASTHSSTASHSAPATPAPTATADPASQEARTPLNLSDPASTLALPASTPWWQSLLDVSWKLALVLALIYLAMRALAALKRSGFGLPNVSRGSQQPRFFEQIEEIRLSPQHTLQAVRAGNKVLLFARSGNTLRQLGEIDPEGEPDPLLALPPESFSRQMMRAWAGMLPLSTATKDVGTSPETLADADDADALPALAGDADEQDVIDAKWVTVEPDAPPPAADAAPPLQAKRGLARSADKPEPLDEATERDILWHAEEHGVSAAAERYGLTRQRVTAMRLRYERERTARELEKHRRDRQEQAAATRPAKRKPEMPDHPRPEDAHAFMPLATTARAQQASTAYARTASHREARPDAARPTVPAGDVSDQAATIAQTLAARFGIRVPPPTK
jgi:flagellar biogenesis protein FliO